MTDLCKYITAACHFLPTSLYITASLTSRSAQTDILYHCSGEYESMSFQVSSYLILTIPLVQSLFCPIYPWLDPADKNFIGELVNISHPSRQSPELLNGRLSSNLIVWILHPAFAQLTRLKLITMRMVIYCCRRTGQLSCPHVDRIVVGRDCCGWGAL